MEDPYVLHSDVRVCDAHCARDVCAYTPASCSQGDRAAWEAEREELTDQVHRFRVNAEGLEAAVVRERKEKEVRAVVHC